MTYAALWMRRRSGLHAVAVAHYLVSLYYRAEGYGDMVTGVAELTNACKVMPFNTKDVYRACLKSSVDAGDGTYLVLPTCVTCQRIREAMRNGVERIDFSPTAV